MEKYITEKTIAAYLDCDSQTLCKIISWTARGESTESERVQVIKGLEAAENERANTRLSEWIIGVIFQYWTGKNIENSGLGARLRNAEKTWKKQIELTR